MMRSEAAVSSDARPAGRDLFAELADIDRGGAKRGLRVRLWELAEERRRFGYWRHVLLVRAGAARPGARRRG